MLRSTLPPPLTHLLGPQEPTSYRIFEPHSTPPYPSFDRTLPLPVSFGFLPPALAADALRRPSPYQTPAARAAYEEFLLSQSGRDYAHYDRMLDFLERVGEKGRRFAEVARREVDKIGRRWDQAR